MQNAFKFPPDSSQNCPENAYSRIDVLILNEKKFVFFSLYFFFLNTQMASVVPFWKR
jgi:hypothetical protein